MATHSANKNVRLQKNESYTIDAQGKSIGRLATSVASIIRGKTKPNFSYHIQPSVKVVVKNIGLVKISEKKLISESYFSTSGYPGKKQFISWDKLFKKNPQELFIRVVSRMIPRTKFKDSIIRNISFK
ncbi:MAG: uL13 family ribosomal protein [Patescibacteria group bacterium]|nr:uL13 family ribosomal protein [Patescibacteria group bacterium]MDD5715072.1 uL13 family ribosomal protein [Patescibacteria group bacterium]